MYKSKNIVMTEATFEIRKFDMSKIKPDAVIAFIGRRRTGKSTLIKDFFYNLKRFNAGIIISGSEKLNRFYGDFIPDIFIHDEYTQQLLGNTLKSQKQIINYNRKTTGNPDKPCDPYIFLVMDDCFYDDSWKTDKYIKEIFFNGRHYKMCYIIAMQYPLGLSPAFRSNIDYVFIMQENSPQNIKRIYENYCKAGLSLQEFSDVLNQCTQDHGALVIDNSINSPNINDQIFWYKAAHPDDPKYKKWRVGSDKYWTYHNKYYTQPKDEI